MIPRGVAMAAVMAVAVTTLTLATDDAGAWTDGVCTTPSGVTVVIDFQELGGGVHVRCAPQPVTNGFEALRQAGIDFSTTVRFPGFLCRIAGKPANDPCQSTSPATAYWSYWIAQRGASWCYSNWGAGNRTPPPGTIEGWSFSLGRTSSTAPAPRTSVPAPLPGISPAPLSAGDCDRRVDAPSPSPTIAPPAPTAPPAIGPSATPSPDGAVGGPAPEGNPGAPDTGPGDRTEGDATTDPAGTDGPPTSEGGGGVDAGDEGRPDDDGADEGDADGAEDREAASDGVALRDEATAAVDLGGGPDRSSSPVGVVVAALLMAALTGGALLARRRSRATDPA